MTSGAELKIDPQRIGPLSQGGDVSAAKSPRGARKRSTMTARLPTPAAAPPDPLEVARHAKDVTARFEAMAVAAHLDLLAYFLCMAKEEADLLVRGKARSDLSGVEDRAADEMSSSKHP